MKNERIITAIKNMKKKYPQRLRNIIYGHNYNDDDIGDVGGSNSTTWEKKINDDTI